MDVSRIGRDYPELQLVGGVGKHALERPPADVHAELAHVLPEMLAREGDALAFTVPEVGTLSMVGLAYE